MWGAKQKRGSSLEIAERRAQVRLPSPSLSFMTGDGSNGGIVFNVSEAGMALSSALPMFENGIIDLRVQFPGPLEWIDLTGQIVWRSRSKKEIGVQFVGLKSEALERIRGWIASEGSSGEFHAEASAPFAGLPTEVLPRMKSWIFTEASRGEPSWPETEAPSLARDEQRDVRNWLFPVASHGETPQQKIASRHDSLHTQLPNAKDWLLPVAQFSQPTVDSEAPVDKQHPFQTETNDTSPPSNATSANQHAATELQFSTSSISTDSGVPLSCTERRVTQPAAPQTQEVSTKEKKPLAQSRSSVTDRRSHRRMRIIPFGYLQMDVSNGGIVLNISEGGIAITTAAILTDDRLLNLNVQFPDVGGWIETSGQIAWRSESKKEAGVRFVALTEEARQRISDWISAQAATDDLREPEERPKIQEEQEEQRRITDVPERGILLSESPAPAEEAKKLEEAPAFSSTNASSLQSVEVYTSPPSPETLAPSRKPHRKPIRFRPRHAPVQREASGWRSARRAFAAMLILAASSLLIWEWILPRNDVHIELTAAVRPTSKAEAHNKPANSAEIQAQSVSKVQVEQKNPQPPQTKPLLAENKDESLRDHSPEDPRQRLLKARSPAKPTPKAASPPAENLSTPEQAKGQSWRAAASVNTRPLKTASQTAGSALPAPPQLEAELRQPTNPAPLSTNTSQPAAPKAKESLMLPAKQPATPANYTGAVAIVADPYPALRLPDGRSSKKQRQATTLQLGHLLSRVEPVYPDEAKQQGIQGTVKLHAVIGRHGNVEKVESVNGPTVLVEAAMNAVRHWRYTETLLAGQSVETEEDIAVIFRLSSSEMLKK